MSVEQVEQAWVRGPAKEERNKMKRTPQPTLTQSRLTGSGMLKIQGASQNASQVAGRSQTTNRSFSDGDSMTSTETFKSPEKDMETSTPEVGRKRPRPAEEDGGMRDFFLQALKSNKEEIIQSLQLSMGELAKKVEDNAKNITDVKTSTRCNTERIDGYDH